METVFQDFSNEGHLGCTLLHFFLTHNYVSQRRSSVFTNKLTTVGLYEQLYTVVLYRSLQECFLFIYLFFYNFLGNETVSVQKYVLILPFESFAVSNYVLYVQSLKQEGSFHIHCSKCKLSESSWKLDFKRRYLWHHKQFGGQSGSYIQHIKVWCENLKPQGTHTENGLHGEEGDSFNPAVKLVKLRICTFSYTMEYLITEKEELPFKDVKVVILYFYLQQPYQTCIREM